MAAGDPHPSIIPSFGSRKLTKTRVLRANFGDGYSQRAIDGLNQQRDEWTVSFNNLSDADADTLVAFYEQQAGSSYFTWTPPREATSKKWIVSEWQRTPNTGDFDTVTAKYEQVHDL